MWESATGYEPGTDYEPDTARSRTMQVSPIVSEAFPVAKTFVFLAASLPKVEKLQPSPVSLFYDLWWAVVTFARWTAVTNRHTHTRNTSIIIIDSFMNNCSSESTLHHKTYTSCQIYELELEPTANRLFRMLPQRVYETRSKEHTRGLSNKSLLFKWD